MSALLEVCGLSLERDGVRLLEATDLSLAAGERVLITGPSGCGKSTLLRVLCGLDGGGETRVRFAGRPLSAWVPTRLRRRLAWLPQTPVMMPGSVEENLRLPLQLKVYRDFHIDDRSIAAGLERLQLGIDPGMEAQRLSPGQQARVALLQRLLLRPEVLLCDEPIAALDPASADLVSAELATAAEQGMAQLMVSHQPLSGFRGRRLQFRQRRLEPLS